MKKIIYIQAFIVFYALWLVIVIFLFTIPAETPDYPMLRAGFGTIMHHSSDDLGGAVHTYCYYPKAEANSKLVIKRQDDSDCSQWYGEILFYEGSYVSEREKYWWSKEQHIQDCASCDDLKVLAKTKNS